MIIYRTENGVKNIQTTGYNGARTVSILIVSHISTLTSIRHKTLWSLLTYSESVFNFHAMCSFEIPLKSLIFIFFSTSIHFHYLWNTWALLAFFFFFFLSSIFRSSALVASHRRNHKKFNHHHQNNSLSFLHKKNRRMAMKHSAM